MPQSALITHAGRCSKRPIKCIRCCQLFPADAIVAHSTNCKFVPGTNPASGSQPQSQPAQQATSRAPIKIPPPPPFPPPPTATAPVPVPQLNTRRATADPRVGVNLSNDTAELAGRSSGLDSHQYSLLTHRFSGSSKRNYVRQIGTTEFGTFATHKSQRSRNWGKHSTTGSQ